MIGCFSRSLKRRSGRPFHGSHNCPLLVCVQIGLLCAVHSLVASRPPLRIVFLHPWKAAEHKTSPYRNRIGIAISDNACGCYLLLAYLYAINRANAACFEEIFFWRNDGLDFGIYSQTHHPRPAGYAPPLARPGA